MPKKTKRQSRKVSTTTTKVSTTKTGVVVSSTPTPTGDTSTRSAYQEFNPDYTYVRRDLKRIGILAGSMFLFLIVLAAVLPLILLR
jgi:hypothetical protein